MIAIDTQTTQGSLNRQLNNTINGIYVCCFATITNKQQDGRYLCQININNSKNNINYKEQIVCKAFQQQSFHQPLKIGDNVLVLFTDYKQHEQDVNINNLTTIKHTASNGVIVGVFEEVNDNNIKHIQLANDVPIIIDSKNSKITLKNNKGQVGNVLNELKTTITSDLKNCLSTGTCPDGPVSFPQLETAITKLENNINSLIDILG